MAKFIATATNATFLHNRDYMEYHSDRFEDFSLMAYDNHSHLIGVLPANRTNNELWSHQGLTYGGWLMAPKHVVPQMALELWQNRWNSFPLMVLLFFTINPCHGSTAPTPLRMIFMHFGDLEPR